MSKDAYYFSHDSNAKDDPKCTMLIEQLGLEGYGIYWVLIETLRDQPSYKYPVILISALSRKYNTTAEKMKTVINSYGLFTVDENDFFSISLLERMGKFENKREQSRIAANMRWNKQLCESNADAMQDQCGRNADIMPNKVKESKGKESKVKESKVNYAETVKMTEIEYGKLILEHGKIKVNRMVEILDGYKAANGKKYASDYRAILNWVVERVNNEVPRNQGTKGNYNKNVQAGLDLVEKYENGGDTGEPVW